MVIIFALLLLLKCILKLVYREMEKYQSINQRQSVYHGSHIDKKLYVDGGAVIKN